MRSADRFMPVGLGWVALAAGAALGGMLLTARDRVAVADEGGGGQVAAAATKAADGPRIEIKDHKFSLPTVTVAVGTTVHWINHDDDAHTVTSTRAVFRSPGLDTDESYSYRFTKPGVYEYFCTLHPLMVGRVIVK